MVYILSGGKRGVIGWLLRRVSDVLKMVRNCLMQVQGRRNVAFLYFNEYTQQVWLVSLSRRHTRPAAFLRRNIGPETRVYP
jgi:hypothetical protein